VTGTAIHLRTAADRLAFDAASGALVSWRRAGTRRELIARRAGEALVEVGHVDVRGELRTLTDAGAARTTHVEREGDRWTVVTHIPALDGHALDVTLRTSGSAQDHEIAWTLAVERAADLRLVDVRFPVLRMPLGLSGPAAAARRSDTLVWPRGTGQQFLRPRPTDLEPDDPFALQLRPENIDALHYPGYTFAQFLAYLDRSTGLLLRCDDVEGRPKVLKPLGNGNDRVRLAIAHVIGGTPPGAIHVPYAVRARSVAGTWEDAAESYRTWSLAQSWAARPLRDRSLPAAITDAPVPVMIRVQGIHDEGPADPVQAFLPYPKALPILDALARRLDAPLLPVLMSWERHGPWVYPDALPPVGGSEAFAAFADGAVGRGWAPGTFCNGTRWATSHRWTGYDGRDTFETDGGRGSVCRTAAGDPWQEPWDVTWRASMPACVGAPRTRELAIAYVRELARLGMRMIQFFDQNLGVVTFPCYASDHGHPAVPGPWMTPAMTGFLAELRAAAREGAGADGVLLSAEACISEPHLAALDLVDVRSVPPGHAAPHPMWAGSIPLFSYLYHELVPISGGFGFGPEPYHLVTATAMALVAGAMPGGVLQDGGRLMARDSVNFGDWTPYVEDWEAAADLLRAAVALRRGHGRRYLLEGRMERSSRVTGIPTRRWTHGDRAHRLPAIFHHTWRAPDGSLALVAANWTDRELTARVTDARFTSATTIVVSSAAGITVASPDGPGTLRLPAHACALLR